MKFSLSFFTALAAIQAAAAYHVKISGRRNLGIHPNLGRRATLFGSQLQDTGDIQYTTNLTMNGTTFNVIADTGSADLYVCTDTDVPGSVDTQATTSITFAVGQVQGPIKLATLEFANYTVVNQAYLQVAADDQTNLPGTGLIGLGPSAGSNILLTFGGLAAANNPLDNIFLQNTSTPNFLTVLLGRSDEPTNPFPGDLTIGQTLPQYANVTSQPQLPVISNPSNDTGNQHWQVLLDPQGAFINGVNIPMNTVVSSTKNKNQVTAVFDSGFSLPQVPKAVSDAFYSPVKGASFKNVDGLGETWVLPCAAEVNISFSFGGVKIPIHPLDASLTTADLNLTDFNINGEPGCIGSFQPVSFDADTTFDMVLGMAFLRNTYMLINFGDFVDGTKVTTQPFIQLLPLTTDAAAAHNDFVQVRVNGATSTGSGSNSSPASVFFGNTGLSKGLVAGIVILVLVIVVGIFGVALYFRRRAINGMNAKQQMYATGQPGFQQPVTYGAPPGGYPGQGAGYPPPAPAGQGYGYNVA